MDNSHLMHELRIMASDIIGLEQGLKRLDLLEFEILQIKTHFNERITRRNIFRSRNTKI